VSVPSEELIHRILSVPLEESGTHAQWDELVGTTGAITNLVAFSWCFYREVHMRSQLIGYLRISFA
jgi:hypothetical protein